MFYWLAVVTTWYAFFWWLCGAASFRYEAQIVGTLVPEMDGGAERETKSRCCCTAVVSAFVCRASLGIILVKIRLRTRCLEIFSVLCMSRLHALFPSALAAVVMEQLLQLR